MYCAKCDGEQCTMTILLKQTFIRDVRYRKNDAVLCITGTSIMIYKSETDIDKQVSKFQHPCFRVIRILI